MLAGKAVGVTPFIGEINEGLQGGSTPQDLETAFQLMHLYFTQPRSDPAAFGAIVSQAKAVIANENLNPESVFNRTIEAALGGSHLRRQPETAATIDQWNLPKALAFYKARFADASNFTFVFVGSFTLDTIKPLVETYIASLPATRAHETWKDLGITTPAGKIEKTVTIGIAPKSNIAIVLTGPFEYDAQHKLAMRAVNLLLNSRLFDSIRQDLGGTYSITANFASQKSPRPQYALRIEWTCDPARANALVERVWQEIASLRDTRLSQQQVRLVRESLLRDYERESQENGYLLNAIVRAYEEDGGRNLADVEHLPDQINALTSAQIYEAAQTYLRGDNAVTVIQNPERR
jgi:zinc protease